VIAREIANSEVPRAPMASTPAVQAIVDRIDPERWFQTMSLLAAFNRNSFSATLGPARDWILSAFEGAQLASSVFPYTLQNVTSCTPTPAPITIDNPIGTKLGTSLAEEWIVVGAHYDSRNSLRCDGVLNPQPGANDNASGCAGVIELARVFAHVPTERSILFMCFSGEEQGLVGSRRYVESLTASGDIARVKHMINLDMIGFDPGGNLCARAQCDRQQQHQCQHRSLVLPAGRRAGGFHLGKRRQHLPALPPVHRHSSQHDPRPRAGWRHPEDGRGDAGDRCRTGSAAVCGWV
jgi:hypothetical protein